MVEYVEELAVTNAGALSTPRKAGELSAGGGALSTPGDRGAERLAQPSQMAQINKVITK